MSQMRPAQALLAGYSAKGLSGSYRASGQSHPFVFIGEPELRAFASSTSQRIVLAKTGLQQRAQRYIKDKDKILAVYSGCVLDEYLKKFSYHGATEIAATLSLAAYVHTLDPKSWDPNQADQARDLAKAILLAWAEKGFDPSANMLSDFKLFCDPSGKKDPKVWRDIGLQIGRAMPHWVFAQDLLLGMNALDAKEQGELNAFLAKVYEMIRQASNYRASTMKPVCNLFSNQVSTQVMAMLSIASLLKDEKKLQAAADGYGNGVDVPWTLQLQENIYGDKDTPRACYPEGVSAELYHQTPHVEPGEIVDRYRAKKEQPFVYSLGSLYDLFLGAVMLERSGFSAYSYQGSHGQNLQMALRFYGQFFSKYLQNSEVVLQQPSDALPGYAQYRGHTLVHGNGATTSGQDELLASFVLGAHAFPSDDAVRAVLKKAQDAAGPKSLYAIDSIVLGYLPDVEKCIGSAS